MSYSIHEHFNGGAVFITGASGYVGALVLEKLLRCTNISAIYVMLRSKKNEDVQSRLNKMLNSSPVMHLLRNNPVLSKVKAVAGDMKEAGLGISNEDRRFMAGDVHTVIHCAADIRLEVGIQELLQTNYEGTRQLLELAATFGGLKAFVHVSSAYTNMNATPGSLVHESIYPLTYGDQPVVDSELVQELLSMPAHNANLRAEGLLAQWNFPNNYTLSKHLAEYMVADYQQHANMPVAIVRPTLISSVARDPYPGYTGNYAGHVGATLAFMVGLFDSPASSNYKASNVWDVIPSDVVTNVIMAAAAALGRGMAHHCHVSPTRIYPLQQSGQLASSVPGFNSNMERKNAVEVSPLLHSQAQQEGFGTVGPLMIIHCGSSTTYPLTIMESWNWGVEVYGAWPMVPNLVWGKCAGPMLSSYEPQPRRAAAHMALTSWKIWLAAKMLGMFKMAPVARKLQIGFESFKIINQPKTDVNLRFSTNNMQRLAALLDTTEQEEFLLLWRPKTNRGGPRFLLGRGGSGLPRIRCPLGGNDPSVKGLSPKKQDREGLPSPVSDFLIRAVSGGTASPHSSLNVTSSISTSGKIARHGAELSAQNAEAVRKMREIPVEWRLFHVNLGAYLYCSMFKMPVPANEATISKPEVVRWLKIKPADQTIRHQFVLYR